MNPQTATVATVEVTVADLDRSLHHYTTGIGLRLLARDDGHARLGVRGHPLLLLRETPGARPAAPGGPGLSHVALRVPDRADLARFARHCAGSGQDVRLIDHVISESAYVADPDGHTVEITWEREPGTWSTDDGLLPIVATPMTLAGFDAEPDGPFTALPATTVIGHVQLKATDAGLGATEPFYRDVLALEVVGRAGRTFVAFGAAGRAAVVVTDRFGPAVHEPGQDPTHLVTVDLALSGAEQVRRLTDRLAAAGYPHEHRSGAVTLRDPSGNPLRVTAGSREGAPV